VEVLVASVIGAFIALVAVGTLKAVSAGAEMVDNNIDTASKVRFASDMIARDLINLYRDKNLRNTKLLGTVEESDGSIVSGLTLYTVGRTKARTNQPEGDVYEVEYFLLANEQTDKFSLMRRLWPNPDEDTEPGGILSVISDDIDVFQVSYFDGEQWYSEWSQEMKSVPELVEVTIGARQQGREDVTVESFVVNFVRSMGAATLSFEDIEPEEESESAAE